MSAPIRALAKAGFSLVDAIREPLAGPRLLIYHQIGAGHGFELDVDPTAFERHLDWLSEHGTVVSLEEALRRRAEPDAENLFVLTFDDGFADMFERGFPVLRERRLPFTVYLTARSVEDQVPLTDRPRSAPISWAQVNHMAESGLATLGAHTYAHGDLRFMSEQEVAEDLERCDHLIRQRTGATPVHFAYPFGYWSESADAAVRDRYESAVLGGSPTAELPRDSWLVNRVPIQLSDGVRFFTRKAIRGLRTEETVRRRLTGYEGP